MKEDFLHYLWKFSKFHTSELRTSNNESVTIQHPGQYLRPAGPDFFNARLTIGQQEWAGNVEIHVKSSDWYLHRHDQDAAYGNVILHVVWEHDAEIFRKDNTEIPVLPLKSYVSFETLENYRSLMFPKSWIFCEKQLAEVESFTLQHWLERLFFERLERKSQTIDVLLRQLHSDWEAVLFCLVAKNFGLNANGDAFLKIAQSIPFAIVRKESSETANLEALLFSRAGLLEPEKRDRYCVDLRSRSKYLSHKYSLGDTTLATVQFFKHRPDNFPTIRLSQLAALYGSKRQLFSEVIAAKSIKELYRIFAVSATDYWQTHYQFDRQTPRKSKSLSKAFIDLIAINTIVPMQFAYNKSLGKETEINLLMEVAAERNSVVQKFTSFGIEAANAFQSQSLLELKSEYCSKKRCLECAIGDALLKNNRTFA